MGNSCLKSFRILEGLYCHNLSQHGYVFRAVSVLLQLAIRNGDTLFRIKYKVVFSLKSIYVLSNYEFRVKF